MSRVIVDNFWLSSERLRKWAGGDPRKVYYLVLYLLFIVAVVIMTGSLTLGWARPFELVVIGANLGLFALTIAYPLQIIVNYKFMPKELHPSPITTLLLIAGTIFYGFFLAAVLLQTLLGIKI